MEAIPQPNQGADGNAYVPFWNVSRFMNTRESILSDTNPRPLYKDITFKTRGAFGSVYSAKDEKGTLIAIKQIPHKTPLQKATNLHELSMYQFAQHPNICSFIASYNLQEEVWFIFEFLEGGTLTDACTRHTFEEREIAYIAREVLNALSYLHSNDLIHRDLKSLNIMMTINGGIKLIDFGLCADVSSSPNKTRKEMVGSPLWIAPEMIRGEEHSFPVDIWSFAICLLELANSEPIMVEHSYRAMFEYATVGVKRPFKDAEVWTPVFQSFIARCLNTDPKARPTSIDLLQEKLVLKNNMSRSEMKDVLSSTFLHDTLKLF